MRTETIAQAAKRTGLSAVTIRREVLKGNLPFTRPTGKRVLIDSDALDAWLEAGRGKPALIDPLANARKTKPTE